MRIHSGPRLAVLLASVLVALSACADDGDSTSDEQGGDATSSSAIADEPSASASTSESTVDVVTAPTTTLPDCDAADEIVAPSGWPHPIPDMLSVQVADVADGVDYRLVGVTNDADGFVIAALDVMFPTLDVSEPTGGATDIQLEFEDADSSASVGLNDDDGDGCWDVEVGVVYVEPPSSEVPDPTEPSGTEENDDDSNDGESSGDADDETDDGANGSAAPDDEDGDSTVSTSLPPFEFDEATAIGRADVITARGAFTLFVTQCAHEPVAIEAAGPAGELVIERSGDDVVVSWTYAEDGSVIVDEAPNLVGLSPEGGALFAEGDGVDGVESLIVEYLCD